MLEGKELEVKIGDYGSASVDLSDKGMLEASVSLKIDLIAELKKLAAKTGTQLDDQFLAYVEKLMGR